MLTTGLAQHVLVEHQDTSNNETISKHITLIDVQIVLVEQLDTSNIEPITQQITLLDM